MSSTVLLLILLSSTFILSRMNILRQIQGLLVVPLVIATGVFFGPRGLFPMEENLSLSLDPVVRVILVWMGFLAGLRLLSNQPKYKWHTQGLKRIGHILGVTLAIGSLSYLLLRNFTWDFWNATGVSLSLAAVFVTSSYFSPTRLQNEESLSSFSYADTTFLILSTFFAALIFLPEGHWGFLAIHLVIPALVGSVAILLIGTKKKLGTPDHLTIAGMVALAAGWALGVSALEVVVGFLLGALLSAARLIPRLDLVLLNTEVPLRLVLYFFAGLIVDLTWAAFLVALALTPLRFLAKWWLVHRYGAKELRLSSVYRFSTLSLPLLLSLVLSGRGFDSAPFLLAVVCFAYLFNDLLLVGQLTVKHTKARRETSPMEAT